MSILKFAYTDCKALSPQNFITVINKITGKKPSNKLAKGIIVTSFINLLPSFKRGIYFIKEYF